MGRERENEARDPREEERIRRERRGYEDRSLRPDPARNEGADRETSGGARNRALGKLFETDESLGDPERY